MRNRPSPVRAPALRHVTVGGALRLQPVRSGAAYRCAGRGGTPESTTPRSGGVNRQPYLMRLVDAVSVVLRHLFGHELDAARLRRRSLSSGCCPR